MRLRPLKARDLILACRRMKQLHAFQQPVSLEAAQIFFAISRRTVLLHLASRSLRQFLENNVARGFVMSHVLAAMGDELGPPSPSCPASARRTRKASRPTCRLLSPPRKRPARRGGYKAHPPIQWTRCFRPRNDDVLRAVLELDVAVRMHHPEVAEWNQPPAIASSVACWFLR